MKTARPVYGTICGRATAGVYANPAAGQKIGAELLALDGWYYRTANAGYCWTTEDISAPKS
jgi:hypothetical protein